MGGRVGRLFRNFNVETRVHREIGKNKPVTAPRHPSPINDNNSVFSLNEINRKDDPLLNRLRHVYVASEDPQIPKSVGTRKPQQVDYRPVSALLVPPGVCEITDVPKGKLTIVEALAALNKHKLTPQEWPPERIAQELMLTHNDTHALTSYFIPFNIKVIKLPRPDSTEAYITDS